MKVSQDQLVSFLSDIKQRVATGDSLEGAISYSCLAEGLKSGEWQVNGAYRIANTYGKGTLRLLSEYPQANATHLNAALVHLEALVQFAYEQGFHELGYDPLNVIINALPVELVNCGNLPRLARSA